MPKLFFKNTDSKILDLTGGGGGSTSSGVGENLEGKELTYIDLDEQEQHVTAKKNSERFNDYVNNVTGGENSHTEGSENINLADNAHSEGNKNFTKQKAIGSHIEGAHNLAEGQYSHAEGVGFDFNLYSAYGDVLEFETKASKPEYNDYGESFYPALTQGGSFGIASHAEGISTRSYGEGSHSEGRLTFAEGSNSHAEGFKTKASGSNSHAQGSLTSASGENSFAGGMNSEATGDNTFAFGNNVHTDSGVVFGSNFTIDNSIAGGAGWPTFAVGVDDHSILSVQNDDILIGSYGHNEVYAYTNLSLFDNKLWIFDNYQKVGTTDFGKKAINFKTNQDYKLCYNGSEIATIDYCFYKPASQSVSFTTREKNNTDHYISCEGNYEHYQITGWQYGQNNYTNGQVYFDIFNPSPDTTYQDHPAQIRLGYYKEEGYSDVYGGTIAVSKDGISAIVRKNSSFSVEHAKNSKPALLVNSSRTTINTFYTPEIRLEGTDAWRKEPTLYEKPCIKMEDVNSPGTYYRIYIENGKILTQKVV